MSITRKIAFVVMVLCVGAFLAQIIYGIIKRNSILNNPVNSYSIVENIEDASKGRYLVKYRLYVNGTTYRNSDMYGSFSALLKKKLFNKTLPVVYDSMHPGFSKILIFKSDFESYHIPYPDSLQWAEDMH